MKLRGLFILFTSLSLSACNSDEVPVRPNGRSLIIHEPSEAIKPFPQAQTFVNSIKPNSLSQEELNNDVVTYYQYWLKKYMRESNGQTPGGGYYVRMKGIGGDGSEITTSEAHGYGMIVLALMAGYDVNAKKYFDGMLNMCYQHYSSGNSKCMSWVIHESEESQYRQASATDGDMDIAYALLLADKQWGSAGAVNYLQMAKDVIAGLRESCLSSSSKRMMLGDWDSDPYTTRSSDWMTGHMRCFYAVTGDELWLEAIDEVYSMMDELTDKYSPQTGLMPDFVVGKTPQPAPEYFLDEYKQTNHYSWNACRYPWRISADYLHFGGSDAKSAMATLTDFFVDASGGHPANIKMGYYLNGKPMDNYSSAAFIAPVITASTTDVKYQAYLNEGWDWLNRFVNETYYSDTITLLNMLLISGNWWNPGE